MRAELSALRDGQPLQNSTTWNSALFEVLQGVDYRKLGVDRWTWGKIFTAETVKIAGTGAVRVQHFVVERSDWLAEGLEAYAALRLDNEVSSEEAEFSRRRLAFMVRRLEALARAHMARRLPKLEDGAAWDPVTTVVQTLLARAWLRGTTSADKPTYEQWTDILSEESPRPESDPASRTATWLEALNASNQRHDLLRKALHEMVRLPQGTSAGFGVADASSAAAAISVMVRSCKLSALPGEAGEALPSDLDAVRTIGARLTNLPTIPFAEQKLLTGRGEQLLGLLRGGGIAGHLKRLDAIITKVAGQLPTTLPHLVRDWKNGLDSRRRLIEDTAAAARVQDAVFELTQTPDDLPKRSSALLGWLAAVPAADVKSALDLAQLGEKLVGELLPHVRDLVGDAERTADFADIHQQGAVLRKVAAKAMGQPAEEPAQ